jgi:hypothetical protein
MADKRMFSKTIVLSDNFLDMPATARCLYFTLGMFADDDGFVNNPRSIMRQCGSSQDDMKTLIAKQYVIPFETGIIVIKHWRINNYLRSDRYVATKCTDEKSLLSLDDNGAYVLMPCPSDVGIPNGIPGGIPSIDKVSVDKDRLDKDSVENKRKRFVPPTLEEVRAYIQENGYRVDAEFFHKYFSEGDWHDKDGKPVRNWKQKVITWASKDSNTGRAQPKHKPMLERETIDDWGDSDIMNRPRAGGST